MAKRSPPLTPAAVKRLVRVRGSSRFRDPRTRRTYSDYAVRKARAQATGYAKTYPVGGNAGRVVDRDTALKLYRVLAQGEADYSPRPDPAQLSARLARGSLNNFDSLVESYRERRRQVTGKRPSRKEVLKARSKFWRALDALEHGQRESTRNGIRRGVGPRSKVARALVDLGIRDPDSTARVGESPKPERLRDTVGRIFRPSRGRV